MKRRIGSILLALVMALSLLPAAVIPARAADEGAPVVKTPAEAKEYLESGKSVVLQGAKATLTAFGPTGSVNDIRILTPKLAYNTKDYTTITIKKGQNVTLFVRYLVYGVYFVVEDGGTLTLQAAADDRDSTNRLRVFDAYVRNDQVLFGTVEPGGTLNLNCEIELERAVTDLGYPVNALKDHLTAFDVYGTVNMSGGYLATGVDGIRLHDGARFNMSGGTIRDFTGYGVAAENATINMTGGEILKNGLTMDLAGTKMTMSGGSITTGDLGCVTLRNYAMLQMTGGTIRKYEFDNTERGCGAVDIDSYSTLDMFNGQIIHKGSSTSGAETCLVRVGKNGSFDMRDGTVTGSPRANVLVKDGGTFRMTGGTISKGAMGVDVDWGGTFSMWGGTVTLNQDTREQTLASGGVRISLGATIDLRGAPVIAGNTSTNGKPSNLMLDEAINITGPFSEGADVGVTANPGTYFTEYRSWDNYNPSKDPGTVFTPDSPLQMVGTKPWEVYPIILDAYPCWLYLPSEHLLVYKMYEKGKEPTTRDSLSTSTLERDRRAVPVKATGVIIGTEGGAGGSTGLTEEQKANVEHIQFDASFRAYHPTSVENLVKGMTNLKTIDLTGFDGRYSSDMQKLFASSDELLYVKTGPAFTVKGQSGYPAFLPVRGSEWSAALTDGEGVYTRAGKLTLMTEGGTVSAPGFTRENGAYVASVAPGESIELPAPERSGYSFRGWYTEPTGGEPVTGLGLVYDTTLYAHWSARNPVVTFYNYGGTVAGTQTVTKGKSAEQPAPIVRDGWVFDGWYTDAELTEKYDFSLPVDEDLTLYPRWTEEPARTVTFDSDGGSPVPAQTVAYGETADMPEAPEKEGGSFIGWLDENGAPYNFSAPVREDLTLTAQWVEMSVYVVTFDSDGGTAVPSVLVEEGEPVPEPPAPEREGFEFVGWQAADNDSTDEGSTDGSSTDEGSTDDNSTDDGSTDDGGTVDEWDFNDAGNGNLMLRAVWRPNTWLNEQPEAQEEARTESSNNEDAPTAVSLMRIVYAASPSNAVRSAADIKIATFYGFGGAVVGHQTFDSANKARTPAEIRIPGYAFDGWWTQMTMDAAGNKTYSGTRYGANEVIDAVESLNLYAKWDVRDDSERTCTVTYELDGGAYKGSSAEVTSTVPYGKAITVEPIIPAREGCSFRGWYLDGMYYLNDLPVTEDLTLTARWEKIVLAPGQHYAMLIAYTGDEVDVLVTDKDGRLEQPPVFAREGMIFLGWFEEGSNTAFDFSSKLSRNVTLTARWSDAFTDVERTAWYYEAVTFAQSQNLMYGVGNRAFDPNGTTSRAMIATIIWRIAGQPAASGTTSFSDVADGLWYTEAVKWAQENGIVTGYEDGTFAPDSPITREQLAAMLYRYAQLQGKGYTGAWMFLPDFPDAPGVSEYADEAMRWMVMNGVINGKDGLLAPAASASRAEAAQMLMGFADALAAPRPGGV